MCKLTTRALRGYLQEFCGLWWNRLVLPTCLPCALRRVRRWRKAASLRGAQPASAARAQHGRGGVRGRSCREHVPGWLLRCETATGSRRSCLAWSASQACKAPLVPVTNGIGRATTSTGPVRGPETMLMGSCDEIPDTACCELAGSVDSPVTPPDAPGVERGPTPETDFHSFAFRCATALNARDSRPNVPSLRLRHASRWLTACHGVNAVMPL